MVGAHACALRISSTIIVRNFIIQFFLFDRINEMENKVKINFVRLKKRKKENKMIFLQAFAFCYDILVVLKAFWFRNLCREGRPLVV